MTRAYTSLEIEKRERRLEHSIRATSGLVKFGIATVIGYIIWSALLWELRPELIIFTTFLTMLIFFSFGSRNRRRLYIVDFAAIRYTLLFSIFLFAYWAAFWFGIYRAGAASLALAVLALNMAVTPIIVRKVEKLQDRAPLPLVIFSGLLLFVAGLLIEVNVNFSNFNASVFKEKSGDLAPFGLFLLAVIADSLCDFQTYYISEKLEKMKWEENQVNHLLDIVHLQSILFCFIASALLLAIRLPSIMPRSFPSSVSIVWFSFWLLLLGFIGSGAKMVFVAPLQRQKMDANALPPIYVGRQLFYLILSYLAVVIVMMIFPRLASGGDGIYRLFDAVKFNAGIVSNEFNETYLLGMSIAIIVWAVAWGRLFIIGFFKEKIN